MTTHDQHADVYATGSQNPAPQDQDQDQYAAADDQQHATAQSSGTRETPVEGTLFADDELVGMRARWNSVQAGFVDDPRECVQKADGLVSDLVDQLTNGFAQARSRLEDQWARGEQASTEDLRVALKRYRSFFERLLSV